MTNETEDALYEMAEQAWNDLWPDEPTMSMAVNKQHFKALEKEWLILVFLRIASEYDGPLSDITNHLGDFGDKWIEKRARAILEDAREAEAQARADALADSREDW